MGKWSVILGVVVLSLNATFVRADMAGASYPDARMLGCSIAVQAETDKQLSDQAATSEPVSLGSLDMTLSGDLSDVSADSKQQRSDVRVLPGGPSSVALFFSALSGLGVWQLGRSARKFHFASVPDWYHTGGPVQIGHVSVLDLDAQGLLALHHDQSPSDGSARFSHPPQPLLPIEAQCFLTAVDVRGPPLLHYLISLS